MSKNSQVYRIVSADVLGNCAGTIYKAYQDSQETDKELFVTIELCDKDKARTLAQNALQRKWLADAQSQGDQTAEEYRAFCKLTIGVPILRAENAEFKAKYDEIVKPLSYEQKLAIMAEPLDLPVTRLMTKRQKMAYLNQMYEYFTGECGFRLSEPMELFYEQA